jgi:hypothetical protein
MKKINKQNKIDNVLSWERLGVNAEVDKKLLCPDIFVDNSSFYCGFIKNMNVRDNAPPSTTPNSYEYFRTTTLPLTSSLVSGTFCVNVSDCFISLPYLCEVNCTNQESKCSIWSEEYNSASPDFFKFTNYTTFRTYVTTAARTRVLTTIKTTRLTSLEDPCIKGTHKCVNNATCVYNPNADEKHTCNCLPGFDGEYCQRDERPCLPNRNKCINNSTCNQFGKMYNCSCPTGFEGYHCEFNIDDCVENICQNGGQCEDLINAYKCNCLSYFSGEHCEIKNQELVIKENVSRSFSVFAICFIIFTFGFFVSLDALRFVFKIEPEGLSEERQLIRKKKLMRFIFN